VKREAEEDWVKSAGANDQGDHGPFLPKEEACRPDGWLLLGAGQPAKESTVGALACSAPELRVTGPVPATGRAKGGLARAEALSGKQRRAIAKAARNERPAIDAMTISASCTIGRR
jgi:hypothetical protein